MAGPGTRRGSAAVHAVIVVTGSSATAIVVGFAKTILAAYYFGTSEAMDAYLVALLLPDIVMQLARTGAFNFIPVFRAEQERSPEEAWQAAGKMLTFWLLLLGVLLVAAFVAAPALMSVLAPGFSPSERAETLRLTRTLFAMAAPLGTGRILAVVLHAERRFFGVGLADVVFQVASLAFLVAFHGQGVEGLAWSQVFGSCLYLLVCAIGLWPLRRRLRMRFDPSSAPVRRLLWLNLPVYIADLGDKASQVVTRSFASLFRPGAVSSLQYAYIPIEGAHRMLAVSLVTALFPFLSRLFATRDQGKARSRLRQAVVATALIFLPVSVALWLLADPLVVLLFERGRFERGSTAMTAAALRLFAPAVFALSLNELLGAAFHARQDTVTPMRAGFVRVLSHLVLSAALSRTLGYRGLALGATLSLYVKLAVLAWALRHVFTPAEARRTARALARVALAGLAILPAMYPVFGFASTLSMVQAHALRSLCAGTALCLATYGVALWFVARRELLVHVAIARRALGWERRRPSRAPELAAPLSVAAERTRVGG
jgi:putative peptidoglycan lipid II flippase